MLALIATMLYPPVTVIEADPAPQVAYEFAFAAEAGETPEEMTERLQEEALDYCRAATRAAGVPGEASACARQVVAQVTEEMDDEAYVTLAAR